MIEKTTRERIISLIHHEVVPAIGCTEPMAVALCTAKATEQLGRRPEQIEVLLSGNVLKNAMGVGIPGTGMIGLPIAVALGALVGKSEYQLEVLKDLTTEAVAEGKRFVEEKRICQGEREHGGGTHTCLDAQSPDGHLYQTIVRQALSPLRLCGSIDRQQLRYHLSHGWRL